MHELYQECAQQLEQGKSIALATIIHADTPWTVGNKLVIRADGSTLGDLGDENLTRLIAEMTRERIETGNSRVIALVQRNGALVQASPGEMGDVQVFCEILHPNPTLLLIGAGHIGEAIVRLAKMLEWRVVVADDRPDFITPTRLPDADERILVQYEPESEMLAPMPLTITPSTFILVATWGWDLPALRQILGSSAAYIGLVASSRKSIILFRELINEGVAPELLARVRVPTGLDLGAEMPMEIALAILAEMLMIQRNATGVPLAQHKGSAILQQSLKDRR
jgi:xanthine dehydrogenase accessory factor